MSASDQFCEYLRYFRRSTPQMHISMNLLKGHIAFIYICPTHVLYASKHICSKRNPIYQKNIKHGRLTSILMKTFNILGGPRLRWMHIFRNLLNGHVAFISKCLKYLFRHQNLNPYFQKKT